MSEQKRKAVSRILLAAAVLMIAAGIFRGEVGTVLIKATKICMECIGIG